MFEKKKLQTLIAVVLSLIIMNAISILFLVSKIKDKENIDFTIFELSVVQLVLSFITIVLLTLFRYEEKTQDTIIKKAIKRFSLGNFGIRLPFRRDENFNEMATIINEAVASVSSHIEDKYKEHIKNKVSTIYSFKDKETGLLTNSVVDMLIENNLNVLKRDHKNIAFVYIKWKGKRDNCKNNNEIKIIKVLSLLILSEIRETDTLLKASKEDFFLILSDCGSVDNLRFALERIAKKMSSTMNFDECVYVISPFIGAEFIESSRDKEYIEGKNFKIDAMRLSEEAMKQNMPIIIGGK